jgi:hypothetical protein
MEVGTAGLEKSDGYSEIDFENTDD